jgi:ParB-like chromosome segregation protein Spo0J
MARLKIHTPNQSRPNGTPAVSSPAEGQGQGSNTQAAKVAAAAPANGPSNPTAKATGSPPKKAAPSGKSAPTRDRPDIELQYLPVDQLVPNPWNPNRFTDEQRAELREEVRRAGRLPKPVLVRPLNDGRFEIVDGQHGWEAARDEGLAKVPCEVVVLTDFEAKRETYVRNQHGTLDRLFTGRLLQGLAEEVRKNANGATVSQRRIAKELNIDEATLRNHMLYPQAVEMRRAYAPEGADETITNLSIERVRKYLELPPNRRDEWLDAGAQLDQAAAILAEAGTKSRRSKSGATAGSTAPAAGAADGDQPHATGEEDAARGEDEEADDDAALDDPPSPETAADAPPEAPLTPAEEQSANGVLRLYRDARPLLRQKILAGLGAYPDAVDYFRQMIRTGG